MHLQQIKYDAFFGAEWVFKWLHGQAVKYTREVKKRKLYNNRVSSSSFKFIIKSISNQYKTTLAHK